MGRAWQTVALLLGVWAVAQPLLNAGTVEAQLSPFFYITSCPLAYPIIAKGVYTAVRNETRNAASLLRLHFHDCFVQGCDASVLLVGPGTEQTAPPNINSLRELDVIETIKVSLESVCPGVVSCADILALAALFSVVLTGGPFWVEPLGRRDSLAPNFADTANLPSPFSDITTVKARFQFQNLTVTDLVALSGAHTIGLARCAVVTTRIYNFNGTGKPDPTLNKSRLATLETSCPQNGDGNVTNPMDISTDTVFDNLYYKNLLLENGLFESDEVLFTAANDTRALVELYASNQIKFFEDFSTSIVKMGNLNVLTGTAGEIRKNCSVPNSSSVVGKTVNTEPERSNERTKSLESSEAFVPPESVLKFYQQILEQVVQEARQEVALLKQTEDTVSDGHASM